MSKLNLAFVAEATGGVLLGENVEVNGVATDSRAIISGNLFVPLLGENADGHDFISQALSRGAVAAIVSKTNSYPCPVVVVEDTKLALAALAKAYLLNANVKVVAITGSVGKTSVKEMTSAALSAELSVCSSLGNLNTEVGLPLSVLRHEEEDVLVLEMAMRGLGQIAELATIAPPDVAVITNIGESHLELLGSRDNIARAKGELLLGMKDGGVAVLNRDDEYFKYLNDLARGPVTTVGYHRDADFRLQNPELVNEGCYSFDLHSGLDCFRVTSPWPGIHNVYNAALAIAAASSLGMDTERAIHALRYCRAGDKRLNFVSLKNGVQLIDDTYNASPTSTEAALRTLSEVSSGRRIAVLGSMLELGPRAETGHREVGRLAGSLCDIVVALGDLTEYIALETEKSVPTYRLRTNLEAIELINRIMAAGDTILIKGSRGLKMEEIVAALREGVV